jgi:4'-phosphopantetheinyl transferase
MPQIFSTNLHPSGNLLLWKAEEESDWFKEQLILVPDLWKEYESLMNQTIRHRWLASRYAVQQVSQQSPLELIKDQSGRPYLGVEGKPVSLSHCEGFVAAIHADVSVGIDVERISSRVQKIKNYFMRDEELDLLGIDNEPLILAWSAKESIYKWLGEKHLGYKSQLCIRSINFMSQAMEIEINTKDHNLVQPVFFRQDFEKVFTWTVGEIGGTTTTTTAAAPDL